MGYTPKLADMVRSATGPPLEQDVLDAKDAAVVTGRHVVAKVVWASKKMSDRRNGGRN